MRTSDEFSPAFASHLVGTTHHVVELFSIVADGMVGQYYTDADIDIVYAGTTHTPYPIKRSKISFSTDLKPNEVDVTLAFNSDLQDAMRKEVLKNAAVSVRRINRQDPDNQNLLLFDGEVGTTDLDEDTLNIKAVTLDFLSLEIPRREYEVACNWRLYDEFCTVGLTTGGWLESGTFNSNSPNRKDLASTIFGGQPNNYFVLGFINSTSGNNNGVHRHITYHVGQSVTVTPPFPYDVSSGDTFDAAPGCDHSITDCSTKFNNIVNYGGYPWIPTQDVIL